jgi:oligopeptide transport system permease protein
MDTRDQKPDIASPGIIAPDTSMMPLETELVVSAGDGAGTAIVASEQAKESPTPLQDSLRRLRRDTRAMISLAVIILFVIIPLIGPPIYEHIGGPYNSDTNGVMTPAVYHNPFQTDLSHQDEGISAYHWLGTDSIGRDELARLMQGMLVSLGVAVTVEIVNIVLGIGIGVLAGFFGGWIDQVLARFTDIMFAFPGLLFAIMLSGIFGTAADTFFSKIPLVGANGNARLIVVSFALAMTTWPLMARFVRGQTLQLKEQQFVEAARTSGTRSIRIILRHIIPNLFSIVIVAATLDISNTIIGEAGLSFLGLGVQTPGSSIGLMINDGINLIDTHPWEVLLPSIVLTIIVLAFSFLGDGLRDAFDPRSKD